MAVTSTTAWNALTSELDAWSDTGRIATLWWRDDDATNRTKKLDQLYALSEHHAVPLCLAVIPHAVENEVLQSVAPAANITVLQHGYAHVNHAPADQKKTEFGNTRSEADVARDIANGFTRISRSPNFQATFVPPWNRIHPLVYNILSTCGLTGLSTFGPRQYQFPVPGLCQVNTHADIIDWRGDRGFAGEEPVCAQLVSHLKARRQETCDANEPTGILTHHLVHTPACWAFLENLFQMAAAHPAIKWLSGREVFA